MSNEPIFLQPVFKEKIWGGQKLKTEFKYDIPSEQTGEAWVIAAHSHGANVIENGPLKGWTLADAWEKHGDLFNRAPDADDAYPLLVKILDAHDDLSVQVHPNDALAREMENEPYGKTECWYVLDAEPDAELVLGHHAETQDELSQMMDDGKWDKLLRRVKVQPGDFVYVPSGTIHAIGAGVVILETQQSSDITYRVYDYDRQDSQGNQRELHLDKARQVTNVPHQTPELDQSTSHVGDMKVTKLVENNYFAVSHWTLNGTVEKTLSTDFLQVSVISGEAVLKVDGDEYSLYKGTNFILPHDITEYELSGEADFVVSWVS
ncbi:mannose-6-phosphate isomerase, class I [Barrientosiimonas marina]|uniref:Mannose-6-phosphate isomerase n=1 Tax=Lentibacillus kimchii TaxID=1542911 RepID=A0ABW2UTU9_9BACI